MPSHEPLLALCSIAAVIGGTLLAQPGKLEDKSAHEQIVALLGAVHGRPLNLACSHGGEVFHSSNLNCFEHNGFRFFKYGGSGIAVVRIGDNGIPIDIFRVEPSGSRSQATLPELEKAIAALSWPKG